MKRLIAILFVLASIGAWAQGTTVGLKLKNPVINGAAVTVPGTTINAALDGFDPAKGSIQNRLVTVENATPTGSTANALLTYVIPPDQITGTIDADGTVTGGATVFAMTDVVNTVSVVLIYKNGILMNGGYTVTNIDGVGTVTFTNAPIVGDVVSILYSKI
jgi:hypothetical protein